jgi:hypothetical protein
LLLKKQNKLFAISLILKVFIFLPAKMSVSTMRKNIRIAKNNGDNQRVKIEKYRLLQLEKNKRKIDIETARNEVQGPVLTKKEVVDLWNQQFGYNKIFGCCALCQTNPVNLIHAKVLELRQTKSRIFVCDKCKSDAKDGWIHKRIITHLVEHKRLKVWLNVNMVRRNTTCFCCRLVQMDLFSSDWHSGHVISKATGGNTSLENLRPICSGCNQDMKTMDMYSYMQKKYTNVSVEKSVDLETLSQCLRLFQI